MKNPQKPLPWSLGEISDILPALCNQLSAVRQALHGGGWWRKETGRPLRLRSLGVIKSVLLPRSECPVLGP